MYKMGETNKIRSLCMEEKWDEAQNVMKDNLIKKFDAKPTYATWWASYVLDDYKANGTPAPPRGRGPNRSGASADEDGNEDGAAPDVSTPDARKAGTKRPAGDTDGKAAKKPKAPEVNLGTIVSLVAEHNGTVTVSNGELVVRLKDTELYHGPSTDKEALRALYTRIKQLTGLSARLTQLKQAATAACTELENFMHTKEGDMAVMDLWEEDYRLDASQALAQAKAANEKVGELERLINEKDALITRQANELSELRRAARNTATHVAAHDEDDSEADEESDESDGEAEESDEEEEAGASDDEEAGAEEAPRDGDDKMETDADPKEADGADEDDE